MTETDEAHERALGHLVIEASRLETACAKFLSSLVTPDPSIGQVVVSQMPHKTVIEIVSALLVNRCKEPALLAQWKTLAARLEAARVRRNDLIHSRWDVGLSDGLKFRDSVRRHVKHGLVATWGLESAADISGAATELEGCLSALFAFADVSREYQFAARRPPGAPL